MNSFLWNTPCVLPMTDRFLIDLYYSYNVEQCMNRGRCVGIITRNVMAFFGRNLRRLKLIIIKKKFCDMNYCSISDVPTRIFYSMQNMVYVVGCCWTRICISLLERKLDPCKLHFMLPYSGNYQFFLSLANCSSITCIGKIYYTVVLAFFDDREIRRKVSKSRQFWNFSVEGFI